MVQPYRRFGADAAPHFAIEVEGIELGQDITQYIQMVEYEDSIDIAPMMRVLLTNPGVGGNMSTGFPDFSSDKAFAPGNEAALYVGYDGKADSFVGKVIWVRNSPRFGENPTVEVIGYSKSHLMSALAGAGLIGGKANRPRPEVARQQGEDDQQGRVWVGTPHDRIIREIGEAWDMLVIADEPRAGKHLKGTTDDGVIQPKGMSDWVVVRSLANLNGYEAWVDYSIEDGKWVLHWGERKQIVPDDRFRLHYGGDQTTLMSFTTDLALDSTVNELQLLAWDESIGEWIDVVHVEVDAETDPKFRVGGGLKNTPRRDRVRTEDANTDEEDKTEVSEATEEDEWDDRKITSSLNSATRFRIAAAGFAIDIITRPFKTIDDAAVFARHWFISRRDSFLIGNGTCIGYEGLRSRQLRKITGIGARYSGDWEIIKVKHTIAASGGKAGKFSTSFSARKVIKGDEGI